MYRARPSTLFNLQDSYTAYCFDEACGYIQAKLDNKEEPRFEQKYTSFGDIYRGLSYGGQTL